MKSIITLIFLNLLLTGIAQEANVNFETPNSYSFVHEKVMDDSRIERVTYRMLLECEELESISFIKNKCLFQLKNNLSEQEVDKAINYCIAKLGFENYIITEL